MEKWEKPKKNAVALFTDLTLFYDAIDIGIKKGYINLSLFKKLIKEEESFFSRVRGLKYIKDYKDTTFQYLIQELILFGYIKKRGREYLITEDGTELAMLYKQRKNDYYMQLLKKMQEVYTIPGWFVDRMWHLNPKGQGQIVIPAPIKEWKPRSLSWENNLWNDELANVCKETKKIIDTNLPDAFPVNESEWYKNVQEIYEHQGKQRSTQKNSRSNASNLQTFSPRKRLTLAMKKATLNMLFHTIDNGLGSNTSPMNSRSFMVWCPRLTQLGLVFYSDYYRSVSGRLLFPTSVYRNSSEKADFYPLPFIKNPNGKLLYLFKPNWETFQEKYLMILHKVYQRIYNKEGIIYVSLQDVRDEVCRLLRINAVIFEEFLEKSYDLSILHNIEFAISLETDIREDQKGGSQMLRRGVFIRNIMYSLIAITNFKHK